LLADGREADDDLRLVALALQGQHHALAPLGVDDVVADADAELLGAVAGRAAPGAAARAHRAAPGPQRGLDHAVPGGAGPAARAGAVPAAVAAVAAVGAAAAAGPALLDRLHEVGGDLVEEAAGRVVLRAAVERPAPRVGQVEALLG